MAEPPRRLPPAALPIHGDHWRSRWLVLPAWGALHRVAKIDWWEGEMIRGPGTTVCGRTGFLMMPGIFSRMGLGRCRHCCARLGIPQGEGAPKNALQGEHEDA